jgi:hypothetical protein
LAFQATGLDGLQEPRSTIEAIAVDYLEAMRNERPEGPYFLGGLCAGGLVAVDIARRLREAGEYVLPLLLLDSPLRPFAISDTQVTDERLLSRLKWRQRLGRINAPLDDPAYANASVRAARAFEHAIRTHEPQPYAGPVCMLSTRERMDGIDSSQLRTVFTGRIERFEVARTHEELLDVHNLAFAKALARCLSMVYESAKAYY